MEVGRGRRCRATFTLLVGLWYLGKRARLHTQGQGHSPEVCSCQKTHSGVMFLCNDKTTGPRQDGAVGLLPAQHF